MMNNVYWDNDEKTILRTDFDEAWTWEDYQRYVEETVRLNQGIKHQIHQLVNMLNVKQSPDSRIFPNVMQARATDPPNLGITAIVGAPKSISAFVMVLERITGEKFPKRYIVPTLEEAYQLIADYEEDNQD